MKYLEYTSILLWNLFRKVFGLLWFWVAVPFRGYARNIVYNYVLENGIYLKRLLERPITEEYDHYIIHPYHNTDGGYIRKRKVSYIEYKLVYWLIWGWLDDDSNEDTYSLGFVDTIRRRERLKWVPLKWLEGCSGHLYGNSFDLGDKRADYPAFCLVGTALWLIRNTAYNFNYMQHHRLDQPFLHTLFGRQFGWKRHKDGIAYEIAFGTKEIK